MAKRRRDLSANIAKLIAGVGASLLLVALALAQPANDHCADATVVRSLPFDDAVETRNATRDWADPEVCAGDDGPNVWYEYVPERDGTVCARTAGSDYPLVLHPLRDGCTGTTAPGDFVCGPEAEVRFRVTSGAPVFVQVSGMPYGTPGHLVFTMADAAADTDGDGVNDCDDLCIHAADPAARDLDRDGVGDPCDPCVGVGPDLDGDGRCGWRDNCPEAPNPGQEDSDGDGFGDACDACASEGRLDADGDGVCDYLDRCQTVANPDQLDADMDFVGDACDACPVMPLPNAEDDTDGDGRPDLCDACPDDPMDACVTALGCTGAGALVGLGDGTGGTFLGWTGLPNCHGLAAQPGTGTFYTIVFDGVPYLATIDPLSRLGTVGPPIAFFDLEMSLAFAADGRLFAFGAYSGQLAWIDPGSGATTVVGTVDGRFHHGGGIAFDETGVLLFADDARLAVLDSATAALTPIAGLAHGPYCSRQWVGALGRVGDHSVMALVHCDQSPSANRWSYLASIDRSTGAVRFTSGNLPRLGGMTVPLGPERCDDCTDDDGDGLVDLDDPDCCAASSPLELTHAFFAPNGDDTTLRLSGRIPHEAPRAADLHFQLGEGAATRMCGVVPAGAFHVDRARGRGTFRGGRGSSTSGITSIKLRADRTGGLRFWIRGRAVPMATPAAGPFRLALAFHPANDPHGTNRCHPGTVALGRLRGGSIRSW
jgi:hypothetical protein